MKVHSFNRNGQNISFCVNNESDVIQSCHSRLGFYEEKELDDIALVLPNHGIIVDVGANVGNHVVYFSKLGRAHTVIPFEPNPSAIEVLKKNIEINNILSRVDLSYIGVGVGKEETYLSLDFALAENNLGAVRLSHESPNSKIRINTLDNMLINVKPDFIKVDVEGMELDVLLGAQRIISECRPILYIETIPRTRLDIYKWLESNKYRIDRTHSRLDYPHFDRHRYSLIKLNGDSYGKRTIC